MENLWSAWSALDARRRLIVAAATIGVFVAVLMLSSGAGRPEMALLYAGIEDRAAGDVVMALEQQGVVHEVRGSAIYVDAARRDELRMMLAAEGLPASGSQGYELLDSLSGFGTTSQMFDAAYWRAKEGELARTILASPHVRAARVHISTPSNRPFQRDQRPTAAVTVTTAGGTLSPANVRALRFLVAAAVSGLAPDDVAVIDGEGGLISAAEDDAGTGSQDDRAAAMRDRVQRLLEARVGFGNAVVELSLDTVTETESIVERIFDPEGRIAISTNVEERSESNQNFGNGDVTVASNLPDGDAEGGGGGGSGESTESRALTNYEVSETQREVLRVPGAVRRLTVAVMVNDITTLGPDGTALTNPRPDDEMTALQDLVASAVGYDAGRGDIITIRSMSFEPIPPLGTEAVASGTGFPLDLMSLIQLAVLALVAIILGLFVVRPILTSAVPKALPPPEEDMMPPMAFAPMSLPMMTNMDDIGGEDPVARLRKMIEERQSETVEILQSWIEEPDRKERQ